LKFKGKNDFSLLRHSKLELIILYDF